MEEKADLLKAGTRETQNRILDPIKYLRWNFLTKQFAAVNNRQQ